MQQEQGWYIIGIFVKTEIVWKKISFDNFLFKIYTEIWFSSIYDKTEAEERKNE